MATSKKTVAKTSKKTATPKKPVASKNIQKTTPAKKQAKPVAKKVAASKKVVKKAPVKKSAPVKKTAKKVEVVKKNISSKKTVTKKSTTTVTAKKATTPVKKTAPAKKAAAGKTAQPKTTVAAAPKKVEIKKAATTKTVASKTTSKAPAKKIVKTMTTSTVAANRPSMSSLSRAALRDEKKSNIIVAHRKLENKSKKSEPKETVEKYQPEIRSILDEPIQETGPVYRYSDEELNEFKELIQQRMEAARKELAYLQGLITRKDEAGTEDTENRYMNMEDGSGAMEREQLAQLASRQIQFISHLEKAMMRIENKTYGICRVTGKLIDKARLRAVPHATLSIEAKKTMTK